MLPSRSLNHVIYGNENLNMLLSQFDFEANFESEAAQILVISRRRLALLMHPLSSFRRIFLGCRLSLRGGNGGEEHHRVSLSIGDDSAVRRQRGKKGKKRNEGASKRDLSSSLTNDRTEQRRDASVSAKAVHSRHVENGNRKKGNPLFLHPLLSFEETAAATTENEEVKNFFEWKK